MDEAIRLQREKVNDKVAKEIQLVDKILDKEETHNKKFRDKMYASVGDLREREKFGGTPVRPTRRKFGMLNRSIKRQVTDESRLS